MYLNTTNYRFILSSPRFIIWERKGGLAGSQVSQIILKQNINNQFTHYFDVSMRSIKNLGFSKANFKIVHS